MLYYYKLSELAVRFDICIFIFQGEVSSNTTVFVVQFIPAPVNNRIVNSAWNGNMSLTSLESAPVLSVIGDTSAMVCKIK